LTERLDVKVRMALENLVHCHGFVCIRSTLIQSKKLLHVIRSISFITPNAEIHEGVVGKVGAVDARSVT
jgi:hypothetical protein